MAPPGGAGRGWCSGCRGDAQSVAVTSAMAALAEAWSTRLLPAPAVAIRAAVQMLLTVPLPKTHPRSSCRMPVLMQHAAESVPSSYVKAGDLLRSCQRHGQWLERPGVGDALVR